MKRRSPCQTCTRVAVPADCDNKLCRPWQSWFLEQWECLRQAAGVTAREEQQDPCQGCVCPREMCIAPCREKVQWMQTAGGQ